MHKVVYLLAFLVLIISVVESYPFVRQRRLWGLKWPKEGISMPKIPKLPKIPNPFGIDASTLPEQKLNDFINKITNQKCLWLDPTSGSFKKVEVNWRRVIGCREYYCNSYGMIETTELTPGEQCAEV